MSVPLTPMLFKDHLYFFGFFFFFFKSNSWKCNPSAGGGLVMDCFLECLVILYCELIFKEL